jgi:hypothetical protein
MNVYKYTHTHTHTHTHTRIYIYSSTAFIHKYETMSFAENLMELEIMMLREISHTHKDKYCMFPLKCGIYGEKKDMQRYGEN